MSKIVFHRNCVFQMTFENGFSISLSSTGGSYSSNRDVLYDNISPNRNTVETIEVACWDEEEDGNFVPLSPFDDVVGYVKADQVAQYIAIVSQARSAEEIKEKVKELGIQG